VYTQHICTLVMLVKVDSRNS